MFDVGDGKVIRGLEEGIKGMAVGGVRTLRIPPEFGYRDFEEPKGEDDVTVRGKGIIDENEPIFMEIELLSLGKFSDAQSSFGITPHEQATRISECR